MIDYFFYILSNVHAIPCLMILNISIMHNIMFINQQLIFNHNNQLRCTKNEHNIIMYRWTTAAVVYVYKYAH